MDDGLGTPTAPLLRFEARECSWGGTQARGILVSSLLSDFRNSGKNLEKSKRKKAQRPRIIKA